MATDRFGNYIANIEPPAAPYPGSPCACGGADDVCTAPTITATQPAPAPLGNDDFANARELAGFGSLTDSNFLASKEAGEPDHAGDVGGHSLWYTWTAPTNDLVTFDTDGSGFDTLLAAYTGDDVASLTEIASNDDGVGLDVQSRISFTPVAGTTYRIAVDGFGSASGDIALNWSQATGTTAVLSGIGNPQGTSTTGYFEWGTSAAYGNTTTPQDIGSGSSDVVFGDSISGLTPGITYHFRAVVSSDCGTAIGDDQQFTAPQCSSPDLIYVTGGLVFDAVVNGVVIVGVGDGAVSRVTSDGITWVNHAIGSGAVFLFGVAYGNGVYLAGGQPAAGNPPNVFSSADGETWSNPSSIGDTTNYINGLAFGDGLFVAACVNNVGAFLGNIYSSPDGVAWTLRNSVDDGLNGVEFGNSMFVAFGEADQVVTSPDGINWTQQNTGTTGVMFGGAAYGSGAWVLTGSEPEVYRSTDGGVTWDVIAVPESLSSISFGNGLFVAQSASDTSIYTSSDGITWALTGLTGGTGATLVRYYKDCTFFNGKQ